MGFFSNLFGGFTDVKSGRDNEKLIQSLRQSDQEFNERMYNQNLLNNRVNQYNDWGSLTWGKDAEGRPVQQNMLNPAEASRLQDFRQIAANRMQQAGQVDLSQMSKPINYAAFPSQAAANWDARGLSYDPFAAVSGKNLPSQYKTPANPYTNQPAAGQGDLGGGMVNAPIINPEIANRQLAPAAPAPTPAPAAPAQPDQAAQMAELQKLVEALRQQEYERQQSSLSPGA